MTGSAGPRHDHGSREIASTDDLPGRLQLVAIASFLSLWAAIVFVPRLWGVDFFHAHAHWVGMAVGIVWWPAVLFLGERWADPRHDPVLHGGPDAAVLLRRVRRAAWRYTLRRRSAWLIAPWLGFVVLGGHFSSAHDQDLIDGQPHRTATVLEAERPLFPSRVEGPRVTVDLGDRTAVLALPFPGEEQVAPGDRLRVVVDPDHPEHVIAVSSHDPWEYTWWGMTLITVLVVAVTGGIWLLWAMSVPHPAARAAARRAGAARVVDLVDVDGTLVRLRDDDGGVWAWTVDERAWSGPPGGELLVIGELRDGAWPVVAAGRHLHWPGKPVRHETSG